MSVRSNDFSRSRFTHYAMRLIEVVSHRAKYIAKE